MRGAGDAGAGRRPVPRALGGTCPRAHARDGCDGCLEHRHVARGARNAARLRRARLLREVARWPRETAARAWARDGRGACCRSRARTRALAAARSRPPTSSRRSPACPTERPATIPPRFAVGQRVRTSAGGPPHHTRLPGYARGKCGRIELILGVHVFADAHARDTAGSRGGSTANLESNHLRGCCKTLSKSNYWIVLDDMDANLEADIQGLNMRTLITKTLTENSDTADVWRKMCYTLLETNYDTLGDCPSQTITAGKSRLAGTFSEDERAELNRILLQHTIQTLTDLKEIEQVLVVSRDLSALALARDLGARTVQEDDGAPSLNTALKRATVVAQVTPRVASSIIPADLPLLNQNDVKALLAHSMNLPVVVIAPDRHQKGTNALLLSPSNIIEYDFGEGSFERHCERGKKAGSVP